MKLAGRAVLVAGLSSVLLTAAAPALAAGGATVVNSSNWYYDDPGQSATGNPQTTPSGVPDGDLAVGYRQGSPVSPGGVPVVVPGTGTDKLTALSFDLVSIPAGSTITDFTFSVPVDTSSPTTAALVAGMPPMLAACLSSRLFTPGKGPSKFAEAPSYDCSTKSVGTYNAATSAYDFKAAPLAQAWVDDVNDGLVIVPDPASNPSTFTLALQPADKITAMVQATPGSGSAASSAGTSTASAPAPAATSGAAPAPAPVPTAGGVPAPGSAPVLVPAAPADASGGAPVAGALAAPVTVATPSGPSPVVAGGSPAPTAISAQAPQAAAKAAAVKVTGMSTAGYVIIALALLVVMALISVGLSTPPPVAEAGTSRLSKLLSSGKGRLS